MSDFGRFVDGFVFDLRSIFDGPLRAFPTAEETTRRHRNLFHPVLFEAGVLFTHGKRTKLQLTKHTRTTLENLVQLYCDRHV